MPPAGPGSGAHESPSAWQGFLLPVSYDELAGTCLARISVTLPCSREQHRQMKAVGPDWRGITPVERGKWLIDSLDRRSGGSLRKATDEYGQGSPVAEVGHVRPT